MRRREYHWNLYHSKDKNELAGLRTDQVEAVFAAIPKAQHLEWFIWKEGLDSWRPLDDFPQLLQSLRQADTRSVEKSPPFPGAQEEEVDEETSPDLAPTVIASSKSVSGKNASTKPSGSERSQNTPQQSVEPTSLEVESNSQGSIELSLMRAGVLEDRLNMRFEKRFEIRIYIGEEAYKNTSTDISLKGMRLREPLPKALPRYFNVEIITGSQRIPVVCSEVREKEGVPSRRLKIEANENASALLTLLLSGS